MLRKLIVIGLLLFTTACLATTEDSYLARPTGNYGVGFVDWHMLNQNSCPDHFYKNNPEDFSPDNTKYCHEIMARIYYPTSEPIQLQAPYYYPLIQDLINFIKQDNGIYADAMLEQLKNTKSYTHEKAPIVPRKTFPVILFAPGSGTPIEHYENVIAELVSHGYIVIGVNSQFIDSLALPNGHIVLVAPFVDPRSKDEWQLRSNQQSDDLAYVLDQIKPSQNTDPVFAAMNLNRVGAFAHSLGAEALANLAYTKPTKFQAVAFLDLSLDDFQESSEIKAFAIPFMHQISANFATRHSIWNYDLGTNGYLVGIYPDKNNPYTSYSAHMSYTDQSTLQYMPALKLLLEHANDLQYRVGYGQGWDITNSMNVHLLKFFDTYLNYVQQPTPMPCTVLTKNAFLLCGAGNTSNSNGSNSGAWAAGVLAGVSATAIIGGTYFSTTTVR